MARELAARPRSSGRRVLSALLALGLGLTACDPAVTPSPSPSSSPSPEPTVVAVLPTAAPTPTPTPRPTPTIVRLPVVPVTDFRTPWAETSADEVAAVLAGSSDRFDAVEVIAAEQLDVLAALGLPYPGDGASFVVAPDVATLRSDLIASRKRLAFVMLDDIDPSVRALGWQGSSLFGVDRVATVADWPLQATLRIGPGSDAIIPPPAYDPATAWTIVAGGDILLDRGVSLAIRGSKDGAAFPFDGGTVKITSRCKDCSVFGWDLPRTKRTGNAGVVRQLISGADLAIANFENPAPDAFQWHEHGTVFSANPAYIKGLADVGIDWVSLANNHIRDAGAKGILDTIDNLDRFGIAHSGAGPNLAAARTPAVLAAGGVKVAILGYDTIAKSYWAGPSRVGSAPMTAANSREHPPPPRAPGANVVIVFPHWGTEYDATPFAGQRDLAHAAIDAGADMVIGNHAHWAAAVEVYDGKPIWYALGNFVFDQTWSEPTMEGITLELTFQGAKLIQVRIRPHLILDKAQPNFMDPAGSGAVVMGQVWAASKGILGW